MHWISILGILGLPFLCWLLANSYVEKPTKQKTNTTHISSTDNNISHAKPKSSEDTLDEDFSIQDLINKTRSS